MSGWSEVRFDLGHIQLAGQLHGPAEGQPVIALHGWLDNANSFARLLPKLPGLRVLALDLAGHGWSGHRPAGSLYAQWEYARDVLEVAEQLGWARFSLIGHSMGAIIAAQMAAALPERIERLALIEGVVPPDSPPVDPAERLGKALHEQLAQTGRRKPVYENRAQAIRARSRSRLAVSESAAGLLAERGLIEEQGTLTWRSDNRLTLTTPVRVEPAVALAMVGKIRCPALLVLAASGVLAKHADLLEQLPFEQVHLPGGHHLHLDDDAGAGLVAVCINRFLALP
jgi:pimeloyl-ACP methyl ester carboxylesterase